MFKLQRLEITGFKSFADYTEIVFTGSGITAVVGPNGCGKSNVSDAIAWVLGEQRARSLRGGEMKDVVFAGTKTRKPGGMAEVVLHLVRDETAFDIEENELEDIDGALSDIDENSVDMSEIEGVEEEVGGGQWAVGSENGIHQDLVGTEAGFETVKAAQVGSIQTIETKVKTKRHWRPRSFALDFAPGEAVSVTRRLYLSGESEYQLNGKTCRLRDITDLFAGTGLSGAHYAIIEQGRIGQILSARPADRRNLIEEAAGISKFRARQRAAESRLDSAKTNLGRISDIVSEIESRVNSLRRQAAKTRRFKTLQDEFRTMLRQLYAAEGQYLSDLATELKISLVQAGKVETDLAAELEGKEFDAREATQAARGAEESLAELRKIHAGNILERDRAEREHLYKSDQIVGLNNRVESLRGSITASEQRLEILTSELERLRTDEQRESEAHLTSEAELRESEDAHREASAALATIESSADMLRSALMQHIGAAERFGEIGRQIGNNLERLALRSEGLEKEAERATDAYSANELNADELGRALTIEEEKLGNLNLEKDDLLIETSAARTASREAEAARQSLEDESSARRHRLATLRELEERRAIYAPQVQKIFAEQRAIGVKLHGVLADRLSIDEHAETAVETLFGPYLEAVLVESVKDARRVSAWLKENNIGRTAMLVLPDSDSDSPGTAQPDTVASLLGASAEVHAALLSAFPTELAARVVADISRETAAAGETVVSIDGDVLIGGSIYIGGSRGGSNGGNASLLGFKRELGTLEKECKRLSRDVEAGSARAESERARLADLESRTVDLQSLIIKVDRGLHGLQIQAHSAREEIVRADRHRKVVAEELEQVRNEIDELGGRRVEAEQNQHAAETARVETQDSLENIGAEVAAARHRSDIAGTLLNDKRVAAATSDERRRSAQSALRRVDNETREIKSALAIQTLERTEAELRIRDLHSAIAAITDRIASAGSDVANEDSELADAVMGLAAARERSDALSDELAQLNRRAGEARNERAEIEIRQAEAVTQLKNTAENCLQELGSPLAEITAASEAEEAFDLDAARRESGEMRNRLDNFGAVNMLALEELGETEERFLFLTSQRQDIIDSIAATEEALREIKQRSREKFKTAFEVINTNFTQFFSELFGGGRGEMTLLESEDILEAGIEVVAQPPGKRLQNILLLSGGEKAMTAIALVLAIFKYRPSPFCLLDEVDAPLDDANVGRFAGKIAEMSEKTQFIVITHNKRTMEAARALYGVTMQEAGVSKVVSVKFE